MSRRSDRIATATRPCSRSSTSDWPHGATLIAATHDRRFVADATDRTIELDDGWIVADEVAS